MVAVPLIYGVCSPWVKFHMCLVKVLVVGTHACVLVVRAGSFLSDCAVLHLIVCLVCVQAWLGMALGSLYGNGQIYVCVLLRFSYGASGIGFF